MQEHDELSVHSNTDVICEFSHHTALHFGLAARVYKNRQTQFSYNPLNTTIRECIPKAMNSGYTTEGWLLWVLHMNRFEVKLHPGQSKYGLSLMIVAG